MKGSETQEKKGIVSELKKLGFSYTAANKLYDAYGESATRIARTDPYRIAVDIPGIGFKTADAVAAALGGNSGSVRACTDDSILVSDNDSTSDSDSDSLLSSAHRTEAGILYILGKYLTSGHTCIPQKKLKDRAVELLDVTSDEIEDALFALFIEGKASEAMVDRVPHVFLSAYLLAERHICAGLMRLMEAEPKPLHADATELLHEEESLLDKRFSEGQRIAITRSLSSGVFVITGGPGTGKTTIIKAIMSIFERAGLSATVAAPTGRAAKRVSNQAGYDASTIHRLLEYYYDEVVHKMYFGRNADNMLEYDAIVIDEASMIDDILMEALLAAIKTGTRLIIVGDADQLPPVGAGDALRDIILSERVPCTKLTEIYRQATESAIVMNAHRIDCGEYPQMIEDFVMLRLSDSSEAIRQIVKICASGKIAADHYRSENWLPTSDDTDDDTDDLIDRINYIISASGTAGDIQVLTPMRKGTLGCANLNRELQLALNPPSPEKREKKRGDTIFREGDRVMQTRNNYSLEWVDSDGMTQGRGIFNGDMGIVQSVDNKRGTVVIAYDETKCVEYENDGLDDVEHSFAITVHKSQGSEFSIVIIPVYAAAPALMTRNLIYTAVTRARDLVVLIGSEDRLKQMIDNGGATKRYSGLKSFLEESAI